ncbi:MAG TPA: hypothetical protein VNY29_15580 [Terriglobales bacterium]|nr:hypothetical protein [Terriglobales bacterium]
MGTQIAIAQELAFALCRDTGAEERALRVSAYVDTINAEREKERKTFSSTCKISAWKKMIHAFIHLIEGVSASFLTPFAVSVTIKRLCDRKSYAHPNSTGNG